MKTRNLLFGVLVTGISICLSLTTQNTLAQSGNYPCLALLRVVDQTYSANSNIGATADPGEVIPPAGGNLSSCESQNGWCTASLTLENSIWYKFVAPETGNVTISTCNSGTTVDTQLALYTVESCSDYSTFDLIGANDDLAGCSQQYASSLTSCVIPGRLYYIQIDGYGGSSGDIDLTITTEERDGCVDCTVVNVGVPCSDGNPNTINDIVTNYCICQGEQPCQTYIPHYTGSLTHGSTTYVDCNAENEYNEIDNAQIGFEYTLESADYNGIPGFITVRSGTYNGPVLDFGYSPLNVISNVDGSLFIHYAANGACETVPECWVTTLECTHCLVECDNGPNEGESCDDGNEFTINDYVNSDCECVGWAIVHCINLGLNFGDPCDDGNPNSVNDIVNIDCECEGNPPCTGNFFWGTDIFNGSDEILEINNNLISDHNTFYNASIGEQYTFTSIDDEGDEAVYITVTSGTLDGPLVGAGYSPLTVTSETDGILFAHYHADEDCSTQSIGEFTSTAQCISCPQYCQNLGLVVGASCNDGDPNTINDLVNSDCDCIGTVIPSNNLCANAEELNLNALGECPTNYIIGTTIGALNESLNLNCDQVNEWVDVFYTFNSGSFNNIVLDASVITQGDLVVSVSTECGDEPIYCDFGLSLNSTINVSPNTNYIVRIGVNLNFGDPGTFALCVSGTYDCPDLSLYFGDSCDDGNDETINDSITNDCDCIGDQPCTGNTLVNTFTLSYSNSTLSFPCIDDNSYNELTNAQVGFDYHFTSSQGGSGGFITVRSGTFDGPILGFGYSPLTVTSDVDGSIFIHYTLNGQCEINDGCFINYSSCVSCPVSCGGPLNPDEGEPCDDGNDLTFNDVVNSACECIGEEGCQTDNLFQTRIFDGTDNEILGDLCNYQSEYNAFGNAESGKEYTFTSQNGDGPSYITVRSGSFDGAVLGAGLSPVTVTSNIAGTLFAHYTVNADCQTSFTCVSTTAQCISCAYDCPALSLNIGDACNDGNPGTENDMVDTECNCIGSIIYDCPALSLNIGDICSDGDPTTFADMITADCNCVGISIYDCPDLSADVGDSCDDGDATTINDEVQANCSCAGEPAGDASLSGSADWNTNCSSRPMEIALYNAGTSTHIATLGFDINADGTFATSMDYLGTFDIYIKIDGYLRKGFFNYTMTVGSNSLDIGTLTPGDLNGDNGVNIVDFSILSNAFGSSVGDANFNSLSDLNCDGGVNIVDFSMLSASFGMEGVPHP